MTIRFRNVAGGLAAAAALPLLAWADAAVALARGWVPLGAGRLLLPVLTGVMLAAASSLAFPRVRKFYGRSALQLLVVSASLLLGLLLAEAILAFRFPVPVGEYLYHLRTPHDVRTFRPDPEVMPGVSGPSRYRINSLGVRGDEPTLRDRYRILCIGGSTTECLYLDDTETWPHLLQEELRETWNESVWVGNAGFSGYGTAEHLEFIRNSPLVRKMSRLILLVGVNDFARALMEAGTPRPFFHDRMRIKPILLTTNLSNLMSATAQSVRHLAGGSRVVAEDSVGRNYVSRRRRRKEAEKLRSLPDLGPALAEFEGRLDAILFECRERGLEILVVGQPVLWDEALSGDEVDLLWMGESKGGAYLHHRELRRGIDLYNERLASWAARRGVLRVNPAEMSGDGSFFYDDCHLSEAGAAELARRIARGLESVRSGGGAGLAGGRHR